MKSIMMLTISLFIGFGSLAVSAEYVPSGTISLTLGDKNWSPVLGSVRDEAYAFGDVWINLPKQTAAQVSYWVGLNDSDPDSDKNDEFDIAFWKSFQIGDSGYLKLRLKYFNIFPVSDLNRSDFMAYDIFVGQKIHVSRSTLVPEIRAEYWHYLSGLSDGMFTIMPGVTHSIPIGKVVAYQRLGLQWNEKLAPFGQLLSAQASIGVKTKVGQWSWTIIDASGSLPLESVAEGDPRDQHGVIAYTTTVSWSF